MFNEYPDVVTIDEAAKMLRLNRKTVKALMDSGELEYRKFGRVYRIKKSAIIAMLEV